MTAQEAKNLADSNQESKNIREENLKKSVISALLEDIKRAAQEGMYSCKLAIYLKPEQILSDPFYMDVIRRLQNMGYKIDIDSRVISWNI